MKTLITLTFTLLATVLSAQYNKANQTVNVLPYWNKGDVYEYIQNEKEYKVIKSDTIINKNKSFDLTIKVLDKDEHSYTLQWDMHTDFSQFPPQLQEELNHQLGNQKFIYKTNENGGFDELINFEEIVEYNKKLVEFLGQTIQNENEKEAFKQALDKVFGNDEVTAQLIVSKINTFHLFFGNAIKKNEALKTKFESINPVTKNKIIYNRSFELEEYNTDDQVYTLYSEILPEENNLIGEIKSTLETIISKEVKEMEQIQNFDFISKVFQATHDSGVILYQIKRDFIEVDNEEIIKELEFILK